LPRARLVVPALVVTALAAGTALVLPSPGPIALQGVAANGPLGSAALSSAVVSVPSEGQPTRILIDGKQVAAGTTGTITAPLAGLTEGRHRLEATIEWGFPRGTARAVQSIEVDTTAPVLVVNPVKGAAKIKDPVTIEGSTESDAVITAAGGTVTRTGDRFAVAYPAPPAGAVIVATDTAGNRTQQPVKVRTLYPSNIRAVHMTGRAWAYSKLRLPVMAMIAQKRINAVQLDIKDEDGIVNFPTTVGLVRAAGAEQRFYNPRQVAAELHRQGIRLIGRIVAFNDPKLANWAMARGKRDMVIQNPDGSKHLYGYNKSGFTNFAHPAVRAYNQAIAVEAIKAGFDDVVFDYIRRPDGPIAKMRFPGLRGDPADSIVSFLAETRAKIRPLGGSLGAAAFAQASTRPKATAQNIRKMAQHLDVVIPMNYPSHWNPGEYGVPDPYKGAYHIVRRSLVDWLKQVKGTDCVVVPWLQDEDFRGDYTPAKVREQIAGTRANGIPGWLMWSSKAVYQPSAYTPNATPAL
jgi:hypothetical protein